MRNLCIALDPTRRNARAAAFAKTLDRNIVGQEQAVEEVTDRRGTRLPNIAISVLAGNFRIGRGSVTQIRL